MLRHRQPILQLYRPWENDGEDKFAKYQTTPRRLCPVPRRPDAAFGPFTFRASPGRDVPVLPEFHIATEGLAVSLPPEGLNRLSFRL